MKWSPLDKQTNKKTKISVWKILKLFTNKKVFKKNLISH